MPVKLWKRLVRAKKRCFLRVLYLVRYFLYLFLILCHTRSYKSFNRTRMIATQLLRYAAIRDNATTAMMSASADKRAKTHSQKLEHLAHEAIFERILQMASNKPK